MRHESFTQLLNAARRIHDETGVLRDFCPFADDLVEQLVSPFHIPAADLFVGDEIVAAASNPLAQAFRAGAPYATWRETYKGTAIGDDFLNRFGCYCLIGPGGGWRSEHMAAFMVYMPPGLWYPYHHHPAEELYYVLAGEAEFLRDGEDPETLRAGEAVFHAANQPHATRTHDQPLLAYVLWRSELGTPPVLTEGRA